MKNTTKLPEVLKGAKRDDQFFELLRWEQENETWLDLSFEIAIRVQSKLRSAGKNQKWLAGQLNCSPQYVGKILKGRENLTLQTITHLERVLGVKLLECPAVAVEFEYEVPTYVNAAVMAELMARITGKSTPTGAAVMAEASESNYAMAA